MEDDAFGSAVSKRLRKTKVKTKCNDVLDGRKKNYVEENDNPDEKEESCKLKQEWKETCEEEENETKERRVLSTEGRREEAKVLRGGREGRQAECYRWMEER